MGFPVYIPLSYDSRYALLGAMAREAAHAFAGAGCEVNPIGDPETCIRSRGGHGLVLFFNFCRLDERWMELARVGPSRGVHLACVQFFVDHPLAMDAAFMESWRDVAGFRMLLPCPDGLHWLGMRWPWLRHAPCMHAISERALVAERSPWDHRPFDVVAAGSIHTPAQLEELASGLPKPIVQAADEMAEMMVRDAQMTFEATMDLCLGQVGVVTGNFAAAQRVWRYVTASVNRRRRVALVASMQGLRTRVLGSEAWSEFCVGTISHGGDISYEQLPEALARARVCLAWGPTQFVHGHSERLLLGMGAGCACVSDERLLAQRMFGGDKPEVRFFDAAHPPACRAAVEALCGDPQTARDMARRGYEAVAERHLWRQRLPVIVAAAQDTLHTRS